MGGEWKWPGVRRSTDDTIEIDFYYRGKRCRERFKVAPTTANLNKAFRFRARVIDAIEQGTFDYAVTFPNSPRRFQFASQVSAGYKTEDFLTSWLEEVKESLKASTFDDYRKIVENTLIPELGQIFLPDLRRTHVKELFKKLPDASNKRLANIQSVLRGALKSAVDDELLEENFMYGWKFERKQAIKEDSDVDPFSADEQKLILNACPNLLTRNLFQFAFWSGLRTSELCALLWSDVDFERGVIKVSKAKTMVSDEPEVPKTKQSRREVKILSPALAALKSQKPLTLLRGGEVFINPLTDQAWAGDQQIRRAWVEILKDAGVRYRRPYQTRHTYASMMLTAGENALWVAGQMGHADAGMINRNYGRFIKDAVPNAGSLAVRMFMQPE